MVEKAVGKLGVKDAKEYEALELGEVEMEPDPESERSVPAWKLCMPVSQVSKALLIDESDADNSDV